MAVRPSSAAVASASRIRYSGISTVAESSRTRPSAARSTRSSSGSATWQVPFSGPPLPTDGRDISQAKTFVERYAIESGPDVSFWTEASLFAQAGIPAIVLGPGNIAQAHVVDEWVSLEQLERAFEIYTNLVKGHD